MSEDLRFRVLDYQRKKQAYENFDPEKPRKREFEVQNLYNYMKTAERLLLEKVCEEYR